MLVKFNEKKYSHSYGFEGSLIVAKVLFPMSLHLQIVQYHTTL